MKSTLRFTLVLLLPAIFTAAVAQNVVFSEDFEGSGIPAGWTQQTNATDGGWQFGIASAVQSGNWPIPAHTKIAGTNDDGCNCMKDNDILITPVIDLSTLSAPVLSVDLFYLNGTYQGNTENAFIQVSTDGGSNFTVVQNLTGSEAWQTIEVDLASYAGLSNVQIGFKYDDDNGWLFGCAIDNVEVFEPAPFDAALTALNVKEYVTVSHTAPTEVDIKGTIVNKGATALTSVDVSWTSGSMQYTQTVGMNLNFGESYEFNLTEKLKVATPVGHPVDVVLSNLNGNNTDGDPSNNDLTTTVWGLGGTTIKNVLIEEFSGAWCQWCPDGAWRLDQILHNTPNTIGVTIHDGDAMEMTDGAALVTRYISTPAGRSGFPSGMIDRIDFGDDIAHSRGEWADNTSERLSQTVPVNISMSNTYDSQTRELSVTVQAIFLGSVSGDIRLNAYVVEDSVTGTGSGYNQVNALNTVAGHHYQGAGNPIVGFVHMQTLRATLGGPWGEEGVIPNEVSFLDTFSHTFTMTLPGGWDDTQIKIVGLAQAFDSEDKKRPILNSVEGELNSDESTELTITYNPKGTYISYLNDEKIFIQSYPNPATDQLTVELTMDELSNIELTLINLAGQEIQTMVLNDLQLGKNKVMLNTSSIADGTYILNIKAEKTKDQVSEIIVITR